MIETYLNEYFNYVKAVFLSEYSKYLTTEKIQKIRNMHNIFKINNDSKFKIFITDKINICTNLEDFILENSLNNDSDLRDINIDGRIYVKYLIDNKNNITKIILESVLEYIIKYFIGNCDSVIKIGTSDLIVKDLASKYNLKNIRPYPSKEMEIVLKIKDLVTEEVLMNSVLNNNEEILKEKYNEFIKNELYGIEYNNLIKELNKKYYNYYRKIGKVYLSDSLYDYENISYINELKEIENISKYHNENINVKINRILSAKKSIIEIKNHLFIYNKQEQLLINNSLIEIESILNKIDENNSEVLYKKFKKIEDELFSLVQKIWKKEINNPILYDEKEHYKFLIGDYPVGRYVETRLISKQQLDSFSSKIKDYGFIYQPNNIIYASTKNFLYSVDSENNVEIDDLSDSKLITPQIIIDNNIASNMLTGKILIENAIPCGIYVLNNSEKSSFDNALVLSDKYELPLVKIECKNFEKSNDEINLKPIKKVERTEVKKVPLSVRLKKLSKKMIYEEEIEDFKKVI